MLIFDCKSKIVKQSYEIQNSFIFYFQRENVFILFPQLQLLFLSKNAFISFSKKSSNNMLYNPEINFVM